VLLGALAAVLAFGVVPVRSGCDDARTCGPAGVHVASTHAPNGTASPGSSCCALSADHAPTPPSNPNEPSQNPDCSLFCAVMCKAGDLKAVVAKGPSVPGGSAVEHVQPHVAPRAALRLAWRLPATAYAVGGREILAFVCVLRV
jgi:hypothetical protein